MSETANYIKQILAHSAPIVWSWGATKFTVTTYNKMEALSFTVSGFIHKGEVIVAYNEASDLFEVYCLDRAKEVVSSHNEVMFDELVEVIDSMVEKNTSDTDYNNHVMNWLLECETEM